MAEIVPRNPDGQNQPIRDDAEILLGGFPASRRDDALGVVRLLAPTASPAMRRRETAIVEGEPIEIPYRVHHPELDAHVLAALPPREQLIAGCISSRHGDGHVRERSIARVIRSTEPWVVPYVVQLLGEYVIEICELVCARAPLASPAYADFARANGAFLALTTTRATSYWNEHHRLDYPRRGEYPALAALERLRGAARQRR